MEPTQASRIWSELLAEAKNLATERRPEEVTIDEFSAESGMSRQVARDFLEAKVKKGLLKKRKTYVPDVGSTVNLYAPTE